VSALLATAVGNRDKYLTTSRDTTLAAVQDKLKLLGVTATAASVSLALLDNTQTDTSATKNAGAKTLADALKAIVTDTTTDNLATLKTNFGAFQKARTTCISQLLKLQAAAYCLACDPTYDTKGVTGSTPSPVVAFSDAVKTRVRNACFPYIKASDEQSALILGAIISPKIDDLNTALTGIAAAPAKKDTLKTLINDFQIGAITTSEKKPVQTPASCTDAACDYILTTWFKDGALVQDLIAAGGAIDTTLSTAGMTKLTTDKNDVTGTRLLEQGRVLQTTWDPTEDEAGVTVSFKDDPAGVNPTTPSTPSGSELMKSGLVSLIVVMLSAFLI